MCTCVERAGVTLNASLRKLHALSVVSYIKRHVDLVSPCSHCETTVDCVQLYILTKNRCGKVIVMPPKKKHGQEIEQKSYDDPENPGFHCTCKIKDCGGDKCKCRMFGVKCVQLAIAPWHVKILESEKLKTI